MNMNIIAPTQIGDAAHAREKWLEKVTTLVGIDCPPRPRSIADDIRAVPGVPQVISQAHENGQSLEDVQAELVLAYVADAAVGRYSQLLQSIQTRSANYAERRESITPAVQKHSIKVYKDARKALEALPGDALNRDVAYAADATAEQKTLITALQTLNMLTGVQSDTSTRLGLPQGANALRYVVINLDGDDDVTEFTNLIRSAAKGTDLAVLNTIRGNYGNTVTAALPTADQVRANYEAFKELDKRRRRAIYEKNGGVNYNQILSQRAQGWVPLHDV